MTDHIYRIDQYVGSSSDGQDAAIANAVAHAAATHAHLRWFEVVETRGHLVDGKIAHWQVTIRVGHTIDNRRKGAEEQHG